MNMPKWLAKSALLFHISCDTKFNYLRKSDRQPNINAVLLHPTNKQQHTIRAFRRHTRIGPTALQNSIFIGAHESASPQICGLAISSLQTATKFKTRKFVFVSHGPACTLNRAATRPVQSQIYRIIRTHCKLNCIYSLLEILQTTRRVLRSSYYQNKQKQCFQTTVIA